MAIKLKTHIALPKSRVPDGDGFDHAHVHVGTQRLYVAHTANDAVAIIDTEGDHYVGSVNNLKGVAGALVDEDRGLVFTSNRGEDTIGRFRAGQEHEVQKLAVGARPNGLAYDSKRGLLLVAHTGTREPGSPVTVAIVDALAMKVLAEVPVPGRTRWAIYDVETDSFYVNVGTPAKIAVIEAKYPDKVQRLIDVPAAGPHGLDLDAAHRRLYCAADDGQLVAIEPKTGEVLGKARLSGRPDVIFLNPDRNHLYAAIGEPGILDVFATPSLERLATIPTESGAHTFAFVPGSDKIYVFYPASDQAAVFVDEKGETL